MFSRARGAENARGGSDQCAEKLCEKQLHGLVYTKRRQDGPRSPFSQSQHTDPAVRVTRPSRSVRTVPYPQPYPCRQLYDCSRIQLGCTDSLIRHRWQTLGHTMHVTILKPVLPGTAARWPWRLPCGLWRGGAATLLAQRAQRLDREAVTHNLARHARASMIVSLEGAAFSVELDAWLQRVCWRVPWLSCRALVACTPTQTSRPLVRSVCQRHGVARGRARHSVGPPSLGRGPAS